VDPAVSDDTDARKASVARFGRSHRRAQAMVTCPPRSGPATVR